MSRLQPGAAIGGPQQSFMEIDDSEKTAYVQSLRAAYGPNILTDRSHLNGAVQRAYEDRRHALNASFRTGGTELTLCPKRLLVLTTQKCTSQCAHCWVFGSPQARSTLSAGQLARIDGHLSGLPGGEAIDWTVSGGEFLTHRDYASVLSSFPVQCVYTNGFWGYPADGCARYLETIRDAVMKNARIDKSRLTFIISYDRYHIEGARSGFPLENAVANIIGMAYDVLPHAAFRISQAGSGAPVIDPLIRALEDAGLSVLQTIRDDSNADIRTVSYTYRRDGGPAKELFVDLFPVAPVCRGAMQESPPDAPDSFHAEERPIARHQYTIGPDGGVGLYEILYAPPVPYCAGNLIDEPWERIEDRLRRDPIAVTVKALGLSPIFEFMQAYYPDMLAPILSRSRTIQQLLYLVLLDPGRRLFLNLFLLARLHGPGRSACPHSDLASRIAGLFSALKAAPSIHDIMRFYPLDKGAGA